MLQLIVHDNQRGLNEREKGDVCLGQLGTKQQNAVRHVGVYFINDLGKLIAVKDDHPELIAQAAAFQLDRIKNIGNKICVAVY